MSILLEIDRPDRIFVEKSSKPPFLMHVVDKRKTLQKIHAVARAVLKFIAVIFTNLKAKLSTKTSKFFIKPVKVGMAGRYGYPEDQLPWNRPESKESEGLYLFIHGLRGAPTAWNSYLKKVNERSPGIHCLAPHVPLGGNCPLEDSAEPLLEIVKDYLKKNPGKPVVLVGTSNGGRIALYIENKLEADCLNLSIISLAGVHYGTKQINRLARWKLLWVQRLHREVAKDFHWDSEVARKSLKEWQEKQELWKRQGIAVRHLFCASTEDEQVRPLSCSLPSGPFSYKIYTGENHLSIVRAARDDALNWLGIL